MNYRIVLCICAYIGGTNSTLGAAAYKQCPSPRASTVSSTSSSTSSSSSSTATTITPQALQRTLSALSIPWSPDTLNRCLLNIPTPRESYAAIANSTAETTAPLTTTVHAFSSSSSSTAATTETTLSQSPTIPIWLEYIYDLYPHPQIDSNEAIMKELKELVILLPSLPVLTQDEIEALLKNAENKNMQKLQDINQNLLPYSLYVIPPFCWTRSLLAIYVDKMTKRYFEECQTMPIETQRALINKDAYAQSNFSNKMITGKIMTESKIIEKISFLFGDIWRKLRTMQKS